ncbi:hypothetical protein CPB84DRAFT_1680158 [Gymnopilus junonius]|uniref:Uncharacterized protein n=1 Tax=Gymnopilus junonius TaxID=109634 RepID=A0A9P5NPC9_GYMJU|nr:hypothetical protein CPB84DRAFT_1680158 [Gymnopilus junonius]
MSLSVRPLDICVTLFCISLSAFIYNSAGRTTYTTPQAYLLKNQVTHSRLLPVKAAHAFTYPTLAFLVSLNALENHRLDLGGGWVFGYGGLWGRITGLRPHPYLTKQPGSIRKKLQALFATRGYVEERHSLGDAWMLTMPSFLGFEGINPLTVYFCYNSEGILWSAVLEIHNTFGESHVHVLEVGQNEDSTPPPGYDYQWTFPRGFHVSPFNDRSGFYTVSVKKPTHPPSVSSDTEFSPPRPAVRVHLYTACDAEPDRKGQLKLTALLRPTRSTPLTTLSLLFSLVKAPLALFLSMPRILFMAWKLHYQKRLDVFIRPEPFPASEGLHPGSVRAGGVKWLDEGVLESFARQRVVRFLRQRVQETGIEVVLIAADPSIPRPTISPDRSASLQLTISYLSTKVFTTLLLCPSAEHALLLGSDTERTFGVSSRELFLTLFSTPNSAGQPTWLQSVRSRGVPRSIPLSIPTCHFLDEESWLNTMLHGLFIHTIHFLDSLEKLVFSIARARIVEGQEPWKQWDRAALVLHDGAHSLGGSMIGSVVRD